MQHGYSATNPPGPAQPMPLTWWFVRVDPAVGLNDSAAVWTCRPGSIGQHAVDVPPLDAVANTQCRITIPDRVVNVAPVPWSWSDISDTSRSPAVIANASVSVFGKPFVKSGGVLIVDW